MIKKSLLIALALPAMLLAVQPLSDLSRMSMDQNIANFQAKFLPQCSPDLFTYTLPKRFDFEIHTTITEDGYYLTLFRVRNPKAASVKGAGVPKPPVFLQHGFDGLSNAWFTNVDSKSIGKLLADQGYDVWLGNSRGNKYSRKHKTLSLSDPKFWAFSFQEMGAYDVPANLQYVHKVSEFL